METERTERPAVLLVEDDSATREAMTELLSDAGYDVCSAASVTEAMERLNGQPFLICDINLPDGLGLTLLRKVRAAKSQMKIAVCSGTTDPDIIRAVKGERPDIFFRKPIRFEALATWLARTSGGSA
jgi:CheY-like chemotaxis protein